MKKLTIITIIIFGFISATSQPCLPEGIVFTTQSQIDSFQINYPGCTEIEGDVIITGEDIVSLNGLSVLTSIGGFLQISFNDSLTSLMGLGELTSVGSFLRISGNNSLTSLGALNGLTSIGYRFYINGNNALISLSGLDNIEFANLGEFTIMYNSSLSTCEVESICAFLSSPTGAWMIVDNATGCNSGAEVLDSCEANAVYVDEQYIKDKLMLYPNPANQELNISVEGFTINELVIYTLTGQQVLNVRPKSETIDISALPFGMYIVEIMVDNIRLRKKLLVYR